MRRSRVQFGEPIVKFPRVADKIAMMAVEIMIARQLTYYAARQKDSGRRCDLEAGMAKLLAARVAWAERRQRRADPRRQRLCAGISGLAHPVRRAHPDDLRGRRRNPGAGHRAAAARRLELIRATSQPTQSSQALILVKAARGGRQDMSLLEMPLMDMKIDHGKWVVVCDGAKALVLENAGNRKTPNLKTRRSTSTTIPRPTSSAPTSRAGPSIRSATGAAPWSRPTGTIRTSSGSWPSSRRASTRRCSAARRRH